MKIGLNKKYRTKSGLEVKIYSVDNGGMYSVHGAIKLDSVWRISNWLSNGINSNDSEFSLVEVSPYEDFKIDDPVYVWYDNALVKHRRHFAGISTHGKPMAFYEGTTSWTTADYVPTVWDRCERA